MWWFLFFCLCNFLAISAISGAKSLRSCTLRFEKAAIFQRSRFWGCWVRKIPQKATHRPGCRTTEWIEEVPHLTFAGAPCILSDSIRSSKPHRPRNCQGRKNHDSHRRDRIWRDFLHWIFRYFLQILKLEKKQKIQWRASSGDGAPKLQISVPCRGRTRPDNGPF